MTQVASVELPGTVAELPLEAAVMAAMVVAVTLAFTAAVVRTAVAVAAMPDCMVVAEVDAATEVVVQPTAKTQRSVTQV